MVDMRARRRAVWLWPAVLAAFVMWGPRPAAADFAAEQKAIARRLSAEVKVANLGRHVQALVECGSRVTGLPGGKRAEDYVYGYLKGLGLGEVRKESFPASVPVNRGSSLEVTTPGGVRTFKLYPLWPNNVRTSQLPPEGLSGQVVWGGQAELTDLAGKPVAGGIVMFDFRCGNRWLNGPRLGAQAVIFVEPDEPAIRGESESKYLSVPINLPRFWMRRGDAVKVLALLESSPKVSGRVKCDMSWVLPDAETERAGIAYRPHNIIATIPGSDPKLKHEVVMLNAYYDSMCIVPEIAPGAESACGIATLLEFARILKAHPPRRTVKLLATAGHFEALTGVREYFGRHLPELEEGKLVKRPAKFLGLIPYQKSTRVRDKIHLFFALDLSSQTSRVGMFYKGYYYNYREDRQTEFSDLGKAFSASGAVFCNELGFNPERTFADCINPLSGKPWRAFIPGKIAVENEVFSLGRGMGVGLVTTDDARGMVDTPWDLPDYVDFANLHHQAVFVACSLWDFLNNPAVPIPQHPQFVKMSLQYGGFAVLKGKVVTFDPRKGLIPNDPLPSALVTVRPTDPSIQGVVTTATQGMGVGQIMKTTFMGVRGDMAQLVSKDGGFVFYGVPTANAYMPPRPVFVDAYHTDPRTGDIDFAPDLGVQGHRAYSISLMMNVGEREATVVTFPCVSVAMFDIVDPKTLKTLSDLYIYDARTDAEPRNFGYAVSRPESWVSHVEDVAVIFAARPAAWEEKGASPATRVKLIMRQGTTAKRMILLNSSRRRPQGAGVLAADNVMLSLVPQRVSSDMWELDESRIRQLGRFRIIDNALDSMHKAARTYLDGANKAWRERNYADFMGRARAAWGWEASAYPRVQSTQQDVVKGVLFYLVLLIPFAYFLERLVFAKPDLRWQIAYTLGIFAISFGLFKYIHPAFSILDVTPLVMLLAFIMAVLAVLVISMLVGKFESQLRALQTKMGGVHRADIGRMNVAMAAFTLGISNMRRRRARTLLTCVTLVLLTFTVLSFTSVVTGINFNDRPSPGKPRYNGILVRSAKWEPLEEPAYRILNDEYGRRATVVARAWFVTSLQADQSEQSFVRISSTTSDKLYDVRAAVGLMPQEMDVMFARGNATPLSAGRWFQPGERLAAIVPTAVAEALKITDQDVGKARLQFCGLQLPIVGILNSARMRQAKDLDGELITPVDVVQANKMAQAGQQQTVGGFQESVHLQPDDVICIPYTLATDLGSQLQSVAISWGHPTPGQTQRVGQRVDATLRDLMPRLETNLYAGIGDRVRRWTSTGSTAVTGLLDIIILIIIASLIVLNTMLGSVYERVREIGIFSSVGLAPSHIGTLFLAEAFVYAIIGAIIGYVMGQGTVKIFTTFDLMKTLYLNYSSLSAVFSTLIVIAVVLLSTMYPARKASEVATPAVDRRWHVPEPVGDEWEIPMPFAVTGGQVTALNAFMTEWFSAYEEYSIGDFVTQGVTVVERPHANGTEYSVQLMAWLAPFDLGVSQRVELHSIPTTMTEVFEIKLRLTRESGDVSSWKRVNRRFLHTLRKQFLIWRTLSADDRERYFSDAQAAPAA